MSVLFTTVTAMWTLVTLLIKLFRRLFSADTCKTKIMPFWPLCCENEAIWFIKFRPGHRVGVFIWKNFHPGYQDLGRKTRARGPFLERPGKLTGLVSYFEIKVSRKLGCVLASNEVHFVSLAENFTV